MKYSMSVVLPVILASQCFANEEFCSIDGCENELEDMALIEGGMYTMGTDLPVSCHEYKVPDQILNINISILTWIFYRFSLLMEKLLQVSTYSVANFSLRLRNF